MKIRIKIQMHENLHKNVNENRRFNENFHVFYEGQLKQQICYSFKLLISNIHHFNLKWWQFFYTYCIKFSHFLVVQNLFSQIQQAPGPNFRKPLAAITAVCMHICLNIHLHCHKMVPHSISFEKISTLDSYILCTDIKL